jgi:hypothetical protein
MFCLDSTGMLYCTTRSDVTVRAVDVQKLVDGTRVRLMFDKDDWYSGKVIGYDGRTGRYRLVFEDGEELEARHALFEPEDGFFLDNGKDCGMVFRASASASCKAALAAEQDADKDRWRAPRAGEEAGGMWLVGRRIRVFWSFDSKFHEAVVEDYDPDVGAVDSRNFVGPVHRLRYDESKHMGIFPENLTKCVWNLDKSQDGDRPVSAVSKRVATALVQKSEESPLRDKLTQSSAGAKVRSSASNGRQGRAAKAVAGPAKPGASQVVDESECMWTAPHWKFKTGGSWLVGRKIKLYWDAERQWFAGVPPCFSLYALLWPSLTRGRCGLIRQSALIRRHAPCTRQSWQHRARS